MKIPILAPIISNNLIRGICVLATLCVSTALTAAQSAGTKLPANARINKNEVIAVQVELRRLGFLKSGITGKLDAATSDAVREYQSANSLRITGRIDPPTYEKLGLPYPAPNPDDPNIAQRAGGYVASKTKEGARYGLEKTWDAGSYAATKSKEGAQASVKGIKSGGRLSGRKTVSMIRRNDDGIYRDLAELFFEHHDWSGVKYDVKDGMVTLKIPRNHTVDVSNLVSGVRTVAGVRSVLVAFCNDGCYQEPKKDPN
jgi:peptidoglycan hydrolase-like protein with peptidoglycan-binding domain